MTRIIDIINVVGLRKILISCAALIAGNTLLYFLAIYPFRSIKLEQIQSLSQLTENYVQMKSVDYSELLSALKQQTTQFAHKERLMQKAVLAEEAIPHYISDLEREAIAAGLDVKSSLRRLVSHKKSRKKKGKEKAALILTINFTCTYLQTISFLRRLERWSYPVFVNSFSLQQSKRDISQIKGVLNCMILEEKSS